MATVSFLILKDDKKKNGTWNVKIRVTNKNKSFYIPTTHFVDKDQINKKHQIKDTILIDNHLNPLIKKYRELISQIGDRVDYMDGAQLKDYLKKSIKQEYSETEDKSSINFLSFIEGFIQGKIKAGKTGSAKTLTTVANSLRDYFKSDYIPITDIRYNFLIEYEAYLRSERTYMRKNHSGHIREYKQKPIGDAGLHSHMRDLRLLFNAARDYYNDEDAGVIRIMHYPFKKYKIGSAPITEHRNRTIEEIIAIRAAEVSAGSRAELARDLFMLSFYLCGMNAADMYELKTAAGKVERINYNRAKTRGKRKDKAFISVKVIDQARPLLEKYAGKLQKRYADIGGLNKAIDIGMKSVSEVTGIPDIDFYDARHSVGTLARNTCGFSTEQVAIALNQKERTVTDIYIAPDWSIVDRVQAGVVGLLSV